jgi:hypothetical protein
MIGRVWRKLRHEHVVATVIVPLWESSTWWGLVVPDAAHLANEVVDWVWLDRSDPDLFVPGSAPGGRAVVPPDWPLLAVRVDFSEAGALRRISSATAASRAGAERAGADRGIDSGWEPKSGWAALDVNRADPVEVELAADMQVSALSHVAGSTCKKYEG